MSRFDYRQLKRTERGAVLAYLQHLSGYSRAQVTRLVSRWVSGKVLVKNYRKPAHGFARRYTGADVALLAEVDRAMTPSRGPPPRACCGASATSSATPASSASDRFRWATCTTCATARRTGRGGWC